MKPIKNLYYLALTIALNLIFAASLGWWIVLMANSFQAINKKPEANANVPVLTVQPYLNILDGK
jgi:hypothetical protein